MKKIFVIVLLTAITFGLNNCISSAEMPRQTLEKELCNGILEHLNEKNHDVMADKFISFIGTTHDNVEFKENGDVDLQLSKDNQVFDITQLQQQHRLCGLKRLVQQAR